MTALLARAKPWCDLLGRVLLSILFITQGWSKIGDYHGMQKFMEQGGVPGGLLPLVILLELGGGLAIAGGLFARPLAAVFSGYCVLTGLLFHTGSPDATEQMMLLKNLGLAGGFLLFAVHGAGGLSLDALLRRTSAGRDPRG